jgi:hypothetical protein
MAALDQLSVPVDGLEFMSFDDLFFSLDDWAVKEKFAFWVKKKEAGIGVYVRAQAQTLGCQWRYTGQTAMDNTVVLSIKTSVHNCVGGGIDKHRSSSMHD